jgi:hypothetical protein
MGVDIVTWRVRLGKAGSFTAIHKPGHCMCSIMRIKSSVSGCLSLRTSLAMAVLLFMAGVELNPGPTCADLGTLINNLSATVTAGFAQCNTKLDLLVADINALKTKQTALEKTVNKLSADRDYILGELEKLRHAPLSSDTNSHLSSTSTISQLVRDALGTEERKKNAIIFNLPDENSFEDDSRMVSALFHDLQVNHLLVKSLSRIGRPPLRSGQRARPLRVELRTAQDVNLLLAAATRLASPALKAEWHTTSISIDRSPPEIEAHRKLMTELRRRLSQGEQVYLHDGKIISGHRQARQADRLAVNLSPLRVALPPLTNTSSTLSASAAPFPPTKRPLNPSQGN